MKPFIQNVGFSNVEDGSHLDAGEYSMLIQISDYKTNLCYVTPAFPKPYHKFKEIHRFKFLDISEGDPLLANNEWLGCSDSQALELVKLLKHALHEKMNVIVHCFAGVCRSGAVCDVGVQMGFLDKGGVRHPNPRVKKKMNKYLYLISKNKI